MFLYSIVITYGAMWLVAELGVHSHNNISAYLGSEIPEIGCDRVGGGEADADRGAAIVAAIVRPWGTLTLAESELIAGSLAFTLESTERDYLIWNGIPLVMAYDKFGRLSRIVLPSRRMETFVRYSGQIRLLKGSWTMMRWAWAGSNCVFFPMILPVCDVDCVNDVVKLSTNISITLLASFINDKGLIHLRLGYPDSRDDAKLEESFGRPLLFTILFPHKNIIVLGSATKDNEPAELFIMVRKK